MRINLKRILLFGEFWRIHLQVDVIYVVTFLYFNRLEYFVRCLPLNLYKNTYICLVPKTNWMYSEGSGRMENSKSDKNSSKDRRQKKLLMFYFRIYDFENL